MSGSARACLPTARIEGIDWPAVVADLLAAGLSQQTIAVQVRVSRATIHGYLYLDAEPRYDTGDRLLVLWATTMQRPRDVAPMLDRRRETGIRPALPSGGINPPE